MKKGKRCPWNRPCRTFAIIRTTPKATTIVYWIITALFCREMSITAYYEPLPHGVQAFTRLGFPNSYFRIELSLAKLAGVDTLLIPLVPARLREWAYAGFTINLISAIIAHLSIREIPLAFAPSTITGVLWRRLLATQARSGPNLPTLRTWHRRT